MHTTLQAIEASVRALGDGLGPTALKSALVADGFDPTKASTIIRWAKQFLKKNQE